MVCTEQSSPELGQVAQNLTADQCELGINPEYPLKVNSVTLPPPSSLSRFQRCPNGNG